MADPATGFIGPPKRWELQQNQPDPAAKLDSGENVDAWVTIKIVYATVTPLSGREFLNAVQIQASGTLKARFRWPLDRTMSATLRLYRKVGGVERIVNFQEPPRNLENRNLWAEVLVIEVDKPAEVAEVNQDRA